MAQLPRCYFDVAVDEELLGRVIFELFADRVPKTAENFRALCTGERGMSATMNPLYYKGTAFHRVIAGFMVQGGDTDGVGGESIYGGTFADEDMSQPLSEAGLLCAANKGADSNASQFFITLAPCEHLNGRHVVIGKVIRGYAEVVERLAEVAVDAKHRPTASAVIINCGELELRKKQAQLATEKITKPERQKKRRDRLDSRSRSPERKQRKPKSRRRRSSPAEDQPQPAAQQLQVENEEELDVRLEREERERTAERRMKELDAIRRQHEEKAVSAEGGVRFKGRGRMRYVDPEMRSGARSD